VSTRFEYEGPAQPAQPHNDGTRLEVLPVSARNTTLLGFETRSAGRIGATTRHSRGL